MQTADRFFFTSGENQIEKDTKIESETPKTISPHCSVYLMLSWPCFLDKQRNGKSFDQHAGRWFFRRDWHPQFGWTEQVRKLALWAFFLFVHAISLELALFIRPMDRFLFLLVNTLHADGRLMFDPLDTPNSSAFPERMFWRPWKTIQKPR